MNYSNGTLHVIGLPPAIDKHQDEIVHRTLQRLYRTYEYAARCADDFKALRVSPDYLKVHFSTCEGCVPAGIAGVSQVLLANADEIVYPDDPKYSDELAARLGITSIQTSTESVARFALVPGAKLAYTSDPVFQAVLPVIQYTNADPATGRYEREATPDAQLSYLIVGPHGVDQIRSNAEGEGISGPYDIDLVLSPDSNPQMSPQIMRISRKPRWTRSSDFSRLVADLGLEHGERLAQLAGMSVVGSFQELAGVVPRAGTRLVPQRSAEEDRLVSLLTWAHEADSYSQERAYLVVEAGPDDGFSCYHPPISQEEFVKALVTFCNYLAAPVLPDEKGEYPQTIDVRAIDETAKAAWELESSTKAQEQSRAGAAESSDL